MKYNVFFFKSFIHLAALLPLVNAYYLAFTDQLGADPVEAIIHFTGIGAFNLLLLSLVITPISKRFKISLLVKFRRLVGLYSFTYALLHLTNFLVFEVQFDWLLFLNEIIDRPYITIGMAGLLILLTLAITSISALKKRMGKNWQKLHNWVYLAVIFVGIHFYWSVKSDIIEPSIYLFISITLLALRFEKFKKRIKKS
ncbi:MULTISPECIES: protein-methionine-sulfoxide reductase heme-binding subunit MsrQ [unclassified Colwellia]|uniref:protein-methionine-sulfoxide reductase heme-binding subunit MsrQ n=1 Tax=unclassified Colwellia TaxID=196834 RepID=UPI0015F3F59A|nr:MULTISPECIES: protein-methionine-sulfoxide reductase heme-binding subunit MsrQ [unclassified Colwellia]MBA6230752.1 protein-methionine-sulfoxide reductase heme-binding subunit MsrQ [Colwellia sp. MB02u-7]MBA6234683.1 protein-methionine-sulfoxide reductase heme-binding subunit MsrQ [Colwellia sp. MB02u-11]MBA6301237.1 protein-methionine-sulfoxide reductase heme-binding subunit MsrQ [Colwellia sp. MB3u-22]MBA6313027.1 protein-methionine-sulfoxide reductase heme-binding subunit MsrQ [Colwellia 